jgi:hypothetical protein
MQDPSVSIIVPTFNRQHQLTRLLHSLDSLIIPGRSEGQSYWKHGAMVSTISKQDT